MLPRKTDVLIVGAGPTGLTLAIALRRAGIDALVVDRLDQGQNTSRAAAIHAHTLEVLDRLGVSDALVARGLKLPHFAIRDRDSRLMQLDFAAVPSRYAYILMIPQHETEAILEQRLIASGGTVHRGVTATRIETAGPGARVHLDTDEGQAVVDARFVIGGDGLHSVVREAAGIAFDGESFPESFVLADIRMDWPLRASEVTLFLSPEGMVVVAPLPDDRYRIVATYANAPEHPDAGIVAGILKSRGPKGDTVRIRDVLWSSRFRVQHRVARRYRSGPLLVMGDAAHVHSPAGGQGMNTGLVDAVVLAELLCDVLLRGAPVTRLDEYERLRRPAAVEVLSLAERLTRIATVHNPVVKRLRNAALRVATSIPLVRRRMLMSVSGLARARNAVVDARVWR
ncbi:FAD-dependent monooxygenase [Rhizobium sp. TRM95111]|uniref:FAD-dependent oxidoreductase n=1 Tax=Rhizobium alarense TaxID=2846851 RepID=UPI001F35634A|nr:NAD(P)/FAD-dependent oxidoreductase [Rhizobium alarense]MCF3642355.1 FAD-dependent monooxygenase [Rhizobium alarense]